MKIFLKWIFRPFKSIFMENILLLIDNTLIIPCYLSSVRLFLISWSRKTRLKYTCYSLYLLQKVFMFYFVAVIQHHQFDLADNPIVLGLCIYGIMWKNIIPYFCVSDMKRTFDDAVRLTEVFFMTSEQKDQLAVTKKSQKVFLFLFQQKKCVLYILFLSYICRPIV